MSTMKPGSGQEISVGNWQRRLLNEDDVAALSRLEPETSPTLSAPIELRVERTPMEFSHLYASLERQVSGIGDITLITDDAMGAERPYVLGVCSAVRGEGKTTTALHLAMTISRDTFKKVCLIDLSMNEDDLGSRLGVSAGSGLVDALEDSGSVVPTLQLSGCDNLVVIPAGRVPRNASKLARSPRVAKMLISARHSFDVVIVDMPAVSSDNALPLSRHVDGLMIVTRAGATPSDVVASAIDTLGRDKVVGVVLNRTRSYVPQWLRKRLTKV
ncbi:MAG: CpsD/CapB family tyrosine-protein kinase [Capsulimonas sp.]|jgi:Mrp family chromosome partitioning ATPase|uniref:CpsD/CapB family tyrosine-protein kinase n=1 Tax=Capsulimonas sp. TaxID=2494211 RepID=UPI003265CAE4